MNAEEYPEHVLKRIQSECNLPAMPSIVYRLLDLVNNVQIDIHDIAEVINLDPIMAGRILKLANSVVFSGGDTIDTIDQAVMRVGFKNVKDIVISISMMNAFRQPHAVQHEMFWRHSLSVAWGAKQVERMSTRTANEATYLCGLLHDIGILVLDLFFNDHYPSIVEEAAQQQRPLHVIEKEILGVDHAQVGALLMERWQLPAAIIEAVRQHHHPVASQAAETRMAQWVHIADFACNSQGIHNSIVAKKDEFYTEAWTGTHLTLKDIPKIVQDINKQVSLATEIIRTAKS
jgi:putative nucleotidyltransferase with HDIG domain